MSDEPAKVPVLRLVLAWGLLMALSPTRFWDLAKVDWNADVIDTRDRHKRHLVRIAGWIITLLSGALIVGLLIVVIREI